MDGCNILSFRLLFRVAQLKKGKEISVTVKIFKRNFKLLKFMNLNVPQLRLLYGVSRKKGQQNGVQ